MPYRQRQRRYRRKRTYQRYRRRKQQLPLRIRTRSTVMPDILTLKLRYTDRFVPTPAAGANYHQVYRGGSMYDPDYTGTGHQPLGFDQIMALYSNFRVKASKIIVRTVDNGTAPSAVQHEQSIVPTSNPTDLVTTDPEACKELPYAKWRIVTTHTGRGSTVQSSYMTQQKIVARKLEDSIFYGSATADATSAFAWHINGQVIDESTTMANVYVYVTIIYYAEFSNRKVLGQS